MPARADRAVPRLVTVLLSLLAPLSLLWLAAGCGKSSSFAPITPVTRHHVWEDLGLTTNRANAYALAGFNGALYAAGEFWDVAGWPVATFVSWNGSIWSIAGAQPNSQVYALAAHDGWLYAGGAFTRASFDTLSYIGAWDGSAWHSVGGGMDWDVLALASYGSSLAAAGVFAHAGSVPALHVARWDGTAWHALGAGLDDVVWALAEYRGELIAGGSFQNADGLPAHYVAAWNGTSWHPLGGSTDLNGTVRALFVHHDTLFVGGHFTNAAGVPATHVACWNGARWDSVGAGLGTYVDEPVLSFATYQDRLVAGGAFAGAAAEWSAGHWLPKGFLSGEVEALEVSGASLYAGGGFVPGPGLRQNGVARWVE